MFERNGQRLGSVLNTGSGRKAKADKAEPEAPSTDDGKDTAKASESKSAKKD